jgi:hypothetical protein
VGGNSFTNISLLSTIVIFLQTSFGFAAHWSTGMTSTFNTLRGLLGIGRWFCFFSFLFFLLVPVHPDIGQGLDCARGGAESHLLDFHVKSEANVNVHENIPWVPVFND